MIDTFLNPLFRQSKKVDECDWNGKEWMRLINFCNTLISFVCKQPSLEKTLLLQFAMFYLRHKLNRQVAEPLQAKKTQIAETMRQISCESQTQSTVIAAAETLVDKLIRLQNEKAKLESVFNSKRYKLLEKTAEAYFHHLNSFTNRGSVFILWFFLFFLSQIIIMFMYWFFLDSFTEIWKMMFQTTVFRSEVLKKRQIHFVIFMRRRQSFNSQNLSKENAMFLVSSVVSLHHIFFSKVFSFFFLLYT